MIKVIKKGNFILFANVRDGYDYDIFIPNIDRDGLESWLIHLEEKNWFTPRLEADFIKVYSNT